MPLETEFTRSVTERQSDQLGDVDHRHAYRPFHYPLRFRLPRVHQNVTQWTSRHHNVCPSLLSVNQQPARMASGAIFVDSHHVEATTIGLARKVGGPPPQGNDEIVQGPRIIGIIEAEDVRGAKDVASIIG